MDAFPHPLEFLVTRFLSADHRLLEETVRQLHLLEIWTAVFFLGLVFLTLFFRQWREIPSGWVKKSVLIFGFFIAVSLRFVSPGQGFETMEIFDSVHYVVPAAQLVQSGRLTLPINQENHPSSKAPGFALLLAPFYLFFKGNLGAGIFCPLLLGLASLLLFHRLAKKITGETPALLGFLLLVFLPLPVLYSRLLMPSIGPPFFLLAGSLLFLKRQGRWQCGLAGFLFGFAAVIRYFSAAAVPAALLYLVLQKEESGKTRLQNSLFLLLGAFLPLTGLLAYQWQTFGSPWLTGYSYWEPLAPVSLNPFSLSYAFGIPPISGGSPNALFNLVMATGAYIPLPNILSYRPDQLLLAAFIWVLASIGFVRFYRNNRPLFFFLVTLFMGLYLPHAVLFSQGAHFMLPAVPFVLLAAANGLAGILSRIPAALKSFSLGILAIGLFGFLPMAYPFSHIPSGEKPRREFLQLMEYLPKRSVFITDFDAALFTHLVGQSRQILCIASSKKVLYADRPVFLNGRFLPPPLWSAANHPETIRAFLAQGLPVHLARFDPVQYQGAYDKLRESFSFETVARSEHFELFRLTLRTSADFP